MHLFFILAILLGCGGEAAAAPDAGADASAARVLQLRIFGNGTAVRDDDGQRCRGGCTLLLQKDSIGLTAAPDDGWLLDGWTGRCASNNPHITLAFEGTISCDLRFGEVPPPDAPEADGEAVDAGTD
jgi:hypothetical protein